MGFDKNVQIFYLQNGNALVDFMAKNARELCLYFTLCGFLEPFLVKDTAKMQFF